MNKTKYTQHTEDTNVLVDMDNEELSNLPKGITDLLIELDDDRKNGKMENADSFHLDLMYKLANKNGN